MRQHSWLLTHLRTQLQMFWANLTQPSSDNGVIKSTRAHPHNRIPCSCQKKVRVLSINRVEGSIIYVFVSRFCMLFHWSIFLSFHEYYLSASIFCVYCQFLASSFLLLLLFLLLLFLPSIFSFRENKTK